MLLLRFDVLAIFCLLIVTKLHIKLCEFFQFTQESPKSIPCSRRCCSNISNRVLLSQEDG